MSAHPKVRDRSAAPFTVRIVVDRSGFGQIIARHGGADATIEKWDAADPGEAPHILVEYVRADILRERLLAKLIAAYGETSGPLVAKSWGESLGLEPERCDPPTGKVAAHGKYVEQRDGKLVCTFCKRSAFEVPR